MPAKRPRTTQKCSWSEENMKAALKAVQTGSGLRESARRFEVPVTTLQERFKKGYYYKARMGRRTIFTAEQEGEIARHLLLLAKLFYGLTPVQLRRAVYDFAETLSIPHKFNREKKEAGKDWMYGFMLRHPRLSFRKPEATSINRIQAFNKEEVGRFYDNLKTLMERYEFPPNRIFNVDETGITTVNRPTRIIGPKGVKQIGAATSGERGKNITVCCCMSASGSFTPPFFIYPRQRMAPALERNGPPGSFYTCSKSGWMTEELFLKWLEHFARVNTATKENPTLLVLDNHTSHISLATYEFCKSHGIHLLSIPPHTSHRIQPLDLTFFSALKKAYDIECDLFLKTRPYEKIINTDVNGIFTKAYIKVASAEKAVKGFEKAGIFPMNPGIFGEEDFYNGDENNNQPNVGNITLAAATAIGPESVPSRCSEPLAIAGCSKDAIIPHNVFNEPSLNRDDAELSDTSFASIVPRPKKADTSAQPVRRRKQRSEILTSTPVKVVLEEKNKRKSIKEKVREKIQKKKIGKRTSKMASKTASTKTRKTTSKKAKHIRKLLDSSSDDDQSITDEFNLCNDDELDDINVENTDIDQNEGEPCCICGECGKCETWYRCTGCSAWVHSLCSAADTPENYVCDFCQ